MRAATSWLVPCLCSSFLVSAVLSASQIPKQLIMTGKPESLEEMPAAVKANVQHTLSLAGKDMKFRWFGDQACRQYIRDHYDADLLLQFDKEERGYYRGDICRAAVLYQEGGFYLDVDFELSMPLAELVGENTTFASAYSHNHEVYNAIIATVPNSTILAETLKEIRSWYGHAEQKLHPDSLMGTVTLFRGMQRAVNKACKVDDLLKKSNIFTWTCGQHHIRMYEEKDLYCFPRETDPQKEMYLFECPAARRDSRHYGLRLGLFPAGQVVSAGRRPVGWSRFIACESDLDGCGSGGHLRRTTNAPIPGGQQPMLAVKVMRSEVKAHTKLNERVSP